MASFQRICGPLHLFKLTGGRKIRAKASQELPVLFQMVWRPLRIVHAAIGVDEKQAVIRGIGAIAAACSIKRSCDQFHSFKLRRLCKSLPCRKAPVPCKLILNTLWSLTAAIQRSCSFHASILAQQSRIVLQAMQPASLRRQPSIPPEMRTCPVWVVLQAGLGSLQQ